MKIYIDFCCHKKKAALLYKGEKVALSHRFSLPIIGETRLKKETECNQIHYHLLYRNTAE